MTNQEVLQGLKQHFPKPYTDLEFKSVYELLIAVILSAQTTDKKVNQVTKELFAKYPTPLDLAYASLEDVQSCLQYLGMQKQKSKSITQCAQTLVQEYNQQVPDSLEALIKLAGVGRKTASAVLVKGFNKPAIVVDTHAARVAKRLGITEHEKVKAEKIEEDLKRFFKKEDWCYISQVIVLFGRYICLARKPLCFECAFIHSCEYAS